MKQYLQALSKGTTLSERETFELFEELMKADTSLITDAQIGAYLFASGTRPITAGELIGAAQSLRRHMLPVQLRSEQAQVELLDTCGTGGSGLNTFNTSTAVAFVVAAAGQPVAKHGNRAATSASGSADVLRELGVNLELPVDLLAQCLAETGFCFMFAPQHHPATRRVQCIRRELGIRTIFNFLGPLVNPAGCTRQLLGVSDRRMVEPMAEALVGLGATRALVVRGEDGLDEITTTGKTFVAEIEAKRVRTYTISPTDFGIAPVTFAAIEGLPPTLAAKRVRGVLSGEHDGYADLVAINAAASLYIAGKTTGIAEGLELARSVLHSGRALQLLDRVVQFTRRHL